MIKQSEIDKLINFWNNCNPIFSHIEIAGYLKNLDTLINFWENNFLQFYEFKNKILIDYGIGGGYLGLHLLQNKGLSKYIGFDISDRQLNEAKKVLHGLPVDLFNTIEKNNFDEFNADIFVCQAVIQHFPSKEYLISFLQKINESKIKDIMLQIRYSEKTTFNENYNTQNDVTHACRTNSDYILKHLTNYYLANSKKNNDRTNYEFLFFKKKK